MGTNTYAYAYDTTGASVTHNDYEPFRQTVAKTGTLADTAPFLLSIRCLGDVYLYYYYGQRSYRPELGRWVNRDPIGEKGELHVYRFAKNNAVFQFDYLGLAPQLCGIDSDGNAIYCPLPPGDWDDPCPDPVYNYPGTDIPFDTPFLDLPVAFQQWLLGHWDQVGCKTYKPGKNEGHMSHCVSTCSITAMDGFLGLLEPIRKGFRMGFSEFGVQCSCAVEALRGCCRWFPAGRCS